MDTTWRVPFTTYVREPRSPVREIPATGYGSEKEKSRGMKSKLTAAILSTWRCAVQKVDVGPTRSMDWSNSNLII